MSWNPSVALRLGRVSNLPTVWTNTLAAVLLVGGSPGDSRMWPLLLAMTLFYIGGMYLNDAFDATIDAKERPERPIPAGQVTRYSVFFSGFAMLLVGLVLLAWLGVHYPDAPTMGPVFGGLLLAVAIVAYNLHHKGNPLSPVVMGICRVMVYITAALCFAWPSAPVFIAAGALLAYLIGLTYVAKQENFGSVENLWPVALLAIPLFVGGVSIIAEPVTGLFWVALLLWIGVALWLIRRRAPGDIPRAVVSLIAGISLVDAILIAGLGEIQFALVAVCGFALTLFLQRYIAGT